jgi:hypothetical protein
MNYKILGLLASLALAAGCDLAKKTTYEGPIDQCRTAGGACTENAECCSYGCDAGACVPGTHEGTVCRTSNDCGTPDYSFTQMLCKSGSCSVPLPYCRDDADVCTSSTQCCGHHCSATVGGICVPNRVPIIQVTSAIQTVPRNQPWAMSQSATASDPDTGETTTLVYGWTITPVNPPGATGWSFPVTTGANPTFTPGSTTATYLVSLTVTDVWGATATASFNLDVVNTPPVVTPAAATASTARNVGPLSVPMSVYDENGDTLTCTWAICRPGTATCLPTPAAPAAFSALKSTPKPLSALFPTGLTGVDEGLWDVTLSCSDGIVSTAGTTAVTVTNTPPAIVVPATRTFNLGVDVATTPNASITALASDANGDAIASWTWTVLSVPTASAVTTASLGGSAATDTAIFKPDALGDYTLSIRVCDPAAINPAYVDRPSPSAESCSTSTVLATVYPYVRPLGHAVTDAAFAKGASLARLVLVGTDSTAGALWDYDLLAGTAPPPLKTPLAGAPNAVTLTPDGGTAVACDDVNVYKVVLGGSPTLTTWTSTISVGDVVALSGSDAFAFPRINVGSTYYQRINLSNGTFSSAFRYGAWGAYVTGTNDNWFVADTAGGYLYRMSLSGQNLNTDSSRTGYSGGKVWSSGSGSHVFAADGSIYAVPATPVATLTPLATTLGLTGIRSVDTTPTESVVLAAPGSGSYVARYGSTFTPMVSDALPHWGYQGADRGLSPLFAFVSNDGTKAFVVVRTTATPDEYGLYTYALP